MQRRSPGNVRNGKRVTPLRYGLARRTRGRGKTSTPKQKAVVKHTAENKAGFDGQASPATVKISPDKKLQGQRQNLLDDDGGQLRAKAESAIAELKESFQKVIF
eukprot:jgi/Bigna1/145140/aug1.95_g19848